MPLGRSARPLEQLALTVTPPGFNLAAWRTFEQQHYRIEEGFAPPHTTPPLPAPAEQLRREAEAYGSEHEMIPDEAGSGAGSAFAQQLAAGEGGGYGYGEEAAGYDGGGAYSPRRLASPMAEPAGRRRLMYAKSGGWCG